MMAVGLLRAAGAVPIIAVDPVKEKREQALALGADYALDPFDPDFAKRAKELTGGGANVAIEVTGKGQGLDQVLDCMKPFGRVALLGCTRHSDFTIDYYRKVHGPGISLIGAHTNARPKVESSHGLWTDGDDARAVHRLITGGRFDLEGLIKEVHLPEEAPAVFTRLANESHFPVVQFDWRNRA
jgi:threonine dehydrogenase-like Zn-dependent dehydrogenase